MSGPKYYFIEGVHGVGKTTLIQELKEKYPNFIYLEENMFNSQDDPFEGMHPQSLLREWKWALKRIEDVYEWTNPDLCSQIYPHPRIFIGDRSPFSAYIYARTDDGTKEALKAIISKGMEDLCSETQSSYEVIKLTCSKQQAWNRIQERLQNSQNRKGLGEKNQKWFEDRFRDYEEIKGWIEVSNSDTIQECIERLKVIIGPKEFEKRKPIPESCIIL